MNILKLSSCQTLDFASPFMRRLVLGFLWNRDPLKTLPLQAYSTIDVLMLISEVVKRINPALLSGAKKKKKNDTCSKAPCGPKEAAYDQEFYSVLRELVSQYPGSR